MITRVLERSRARAGTRRAPHVEDPPVAGGVAEAPIYALTDAAAIGAYLQALTTPAIVDSCAPSDGFNFNAGVGQFTVGAFLGGGSFDADGNAATVATPHGQGLPQSHGVDAATSEAWEAGDASLFAFDSAAWLLLARLTVTAIASDGFTRTVLGRGGTASPHFALVVVDDGTLKVQAKVGFGGPPTNVTLAGSVADGVPRWVAVYRSITGSVLGVARAGVAPATVALGAGSTGAAGTGAIFTFGDLLSGSSPPFRGGPTAVLDHLLGFTANAEAMITNIADILTALEAAEG